LVCKRLGPAEDGCQRLHGVPHDVVVRLLRGERHPRRLGVETQLPRPWLSGAEPVAHDARPHPASGAVLGDLFEEIVVRVEEERDPRREDVDIETGIDAVLHVLDAIAQREGQLLRRRRAGLANVVPTDGYGFHRGTCSAQKAKTSVTSRIDGRGGKMNSFWAMNSLRMSFCSVPESNGHATPCRSATTRYIANSMAAGPLIVIDVLTESRRMPANRVSMSASDATLTPHLPTSPSDSGSSGSRPIKVGRSNATLNPVPRR
jgi:hypothetical protein